MRLPKLHNKTSSTAGLFPCVTKEGWSLLVVIKQAFSIEAHGGVSSTPGASIRHGDEPWGEPSASSIRYPHDIAPAKVNTDVVIVGDALTPGGQMQTELPVRAEVADVGLSANILGPRTWVDSGHGIAPTAPLPFSRAELRWEHAYGGSDASDPDKFLEEARNPVGRGIAGDPRQLIGTLAPHIEDPASPIRDHRSRPAPVGFGVLGPNFEPRRSAAGTHDDEWTRRRMPIPPIDQTDVFHQVAPPALQTAGHLRGGESVRLLGMHERGALSFDIPQDCFLVETADAGGTRELIPALDTLLIEPNRLSFELVWRATFVWPHLPSRRNTVVVRRLGAT